MAFLKDKLQSASFRGVGFQVESSGFETGRRTQVHEYPQRDKPYAQDMGRKTREIEFDAFVIGTDYVEKAGALLAAMEEYGSGTLIHPWLGTLKVNALNCRVHFDAGLGQAKFGLQFVEAGELSFPSASQSTAALSRAGAASLETNSVNWFAKTFKTLGYVSEVASKALTLYGKVLYFISNPAFALSSAMGYGSLLGNLNSLYALFSTPVDLGWSFAGLLNLSGKAKSGELTQGATSAYQQDAILTPMIIGLARMAVDPTLATPTQDPALTATTAQINANDNAILANTRQLLIVQAVGLSSYLNCSVYDDVQAVKVALASAIDAEVLQVTDDDLYQSLMSCRSAMWQDLTDRSRDSARLSALTTAEVVPMLAIAYDYYEDAGRDLEIVARNKIINPGFVPVVPLLVLSR